MIDPRTRDVIPMPTKAQSDEANRLFASYVPQPIPKIDIDELIAIGEKMLEESKANDKI